MSVAVPDLVNPILGWRSWLVALDGGEPRLRSVVRSDLWEPRRPFVAACAMSRGSAAFAPHTPPGSCCTCGVHAARERREAASHLAPPSRRHGFAAIGRVALWGEVVEGERGWRAQWAYPTLLELLVWRDDAHVEADREWMRRSLQRAYGIPVFAQPVGTSDSVSAAASVARTRSGGASSEQWLQ